MVGVGYINICVSKRSKEELALGKGLWVIDNIIQSYHKENKQ